MISQYSSIGRFSKHITIAVTKPRSGARLDSVRVNISQEVLARGMQTSYSMKAVARYDNRPPFAEYKDSPPRTHHIEDGVFGTEKKARDFRDEIVCNLREAGLNLRVEDLLIEIPVIREPTLTK